MNLVEFNALKPGDKIDNPMSGSRGEVIEADKTGVRVKWGHAHGLDDTGMPRHYSRMSTIWFHWSKADV